jgi:poly-gamma-glutamate capsule biosynthesis protein CapA/YwtB (metallophosphatase superfamily)
MSSIQNIGNEMKSHRNKDSIMTCYLRCFIPALVVLFVFTACADAPLDRDNEALTLVIAGQALIKIDPRLSWDDPFGTVRPIVEEADIAFTNFEMAINGPDNQCGVPEDYITILGKPRIPPEDRPGNVSNPHAVKAPVMEFLSDMGFDLMSLANNHTWDLGECGVEVTRATADRYGITHAGAGSTEKEATAPAYLDVRGTRFALIASTTSHDERDRISANVNGVWTGHQDDWDRNIDAVREAAQNADIVIYYHHFQIDVDVFANVVDGGATADGHIKVDDVEQWQTNFARAVIDAGASMYIGNGHRGFDGLEIYKGRPLFRQIGGFAYQGLNPNIGHYDQHRPWSGLLTIMTIDDKSIGSIELVPLELDEGAGYRDEYDDIGFLTRRGLAEVAAGETAVEILQLFKKLSKEYGTEVEIKGERAIVKLAGT